MIEMRKTITLGLMMSKRLADDIAAYAPQGVSVRWIGSETEARACDGVIVDATEFAGVLPGQVVLVLGDVNGAAEERLRKSGSVVMDRHLRTHIDTLLMAFAAFAEQQALVSVVAGDVY
ncbi:hypothetical protein INS45_09745 [Corynebacterium aurimucosum]|nr:hypothetical protein [Corynebacterium aurimucosum]OFK62119.1 hypothetical protein HMPREF2808_12610 [Corynebacterium sp. HMSC078A10]